MRPIRLIATALLAAAATLAPAQAHAFAGFKFYTTRAAFLAALGNTATHKVDLNAIPTPGGSAVVSSIDGGQINVSTTSNFGPGVGPTGAPMVLDPVALGLGSSYGVNNLLSFTHANFTGRIDLDLVPTNVTGFAFEFANGDDNVTSAFVGALQENGSASFYNPTPRPAGQFSFIGVTIDPTLMVPATNVSLVEYGVTVPDGQSTQAYLRNLEYSSAPVVTATPEPATVALLGGGLVLLGGVARRRKARQG